MPERASLRPTSSRRPDVGLSLGANPIEFTQDQVGSTLVGRSLHLDQGGAELPVNLDLDPVHDAALDDLARDGNVRVRLAQCDDRRLDLSRGGRDGG